MASAPTDRIPKHTAVLPFVGLVVAVALGSPELGMMSLVLAAALIANVVAAVHHAEVVAIRVGEPYGSLILALSVTVIEVGLIVSIMLSGEPKPALLRDTVHAVVMLVLHGLAGICIVIAALKHRTVEFRVEGTSAFLAVLLPMAVLVLVVPNHVISAPGPYYTLLQLGFVSLACLGLYAAFLFIQTHWHKDYFLLAADAPQTGSLPRPSARIALISFALLVVALLAVVLLAKALAPSIAGGVAVVGAPVAIIGVIIAAIVLLPETAAAMRAAARNRLQSSLNLALGSVVACIGLSVPVLAVVSYMTGVPLQLGISDGSSVLLMLGFAVAMITYGTGSTTLLAGIVHLVLFATYIFSVFAP